MKKIAELLTAVPGQKVVVLSALSGTTNALVSIGEHLLAGKPEQADREIDALEQHYISFVEALYPSANFNAIGKEVVSRFFIFIKLLAAGRFDDTGFRELLAQGELMSTELFYHHLQERKINARLLPALHFMSIDENEEPELAKIEQRLNPLLASLQHVDIIITQGYICRNHRNEIDNLKRGGSDYTASLIGVALRAEEIQIWTDIDGMHNNDPRVVRKTVPISELTFDEASELAYFGAKILHPATIVPAQKYRVPVRLKNTMDDQAPGTLISDKGAEGSFKAVAAKDGIIAINIKSSRMLMAYGFLRKVFEIFEQYKTPIDMISTSEVAVSLTVDNPKHLNEIVTELGTFGTIEVDADQSIICLVGQKIGGQAGILEKVFQALRTVPVRMVSAGGSANNISVLVQTVHKEKALNALNEHLFGLV
jgi:aspartate kinase